MVIRNFYGEESSQHQHQYIVWLNVSFEGFLIQNYTTFAYKALRQISTIIMMIKGIYWTPSKMVLGKQSSLLLYLPFFWKG